MSRNKHASHIPMSTCTTFTSLRAVEWFRECLSPTIYFTTVAWFRGSLSPTVITPRPFLILISIVAFVALAVPAFKHLGHAIARVDNDASVFAVLGKATHLATQRRASVASLGST